MTTAPEKGSFKIHTAVRKITSASGYEIYWTYFDTCLTKNAIVTEIQHMVLSTTVLRKLIQYTCICLTISLIMLTKLVDLRIFTAINQ